MSDQKRDRGPRRRRRPPVDDRFRELAGPLGNVLGRLPDVERRVVELRMGLVDGHPRTLAETARELSLTNHEAKQIEERAFARIREVVPLDKLQKLLGDGER
jgi:RNA polymerase primary sigma factor